MDFTIGKVVKNEQGLIIPIKDLKRLAQDFLKTGDPEYDRIRYAFMHQLDVRGVVVATIAKEYVSIALPDLVEEVRVYAEKLAPYHCPFDVLFTLSGFSKSAYVEELLGSTMGYEPPVRGLRSAVLEVTFPVPNTAHGVFAYDFKSGIDLYLKKKAGKQFARFHYTLEEVSKEKIEHILHPRYAHLGIASPDQPILYMHCSSGGATFAVAPIKGGVWMHNFVEYVDQLFSLINLVLEEMKAQVPV